MTTTPSPADVEALLFELRHRDLEAEPMTLEDLEHSLEQWVALESMTFGLYAIDPHGANDAAISGLVAIVQAHIEARRLRIEEVHRVRRDLAGLTARDPVPPPPVRLPEDEETARAWDEWARSQPTIGSVQR
jgi:hypothetical protein